MTNRLVTALGRAVRAAFGSPTAVGTRARSERATHPTSSGDYPGDFAGRPTITYAPRADRDADPGEVVWAWVPYEEDHGLGKDRPVLVIGRDGPWLLAAPLTSEDHDRDAAQEASVGRHWMDIGSGSWDPRRRPSEVRLDRIVRVDPDQVRRTGGRLDEGLFLAVADAILARRR